MSKLENSTNQPAPPIPPPPGPLPPDPDFFNKA